MSESDFVNYNRNALTLYIFRQLGFLSPLSALLLSHGLLCLFYFLQFSLVLGQELRKNRQSRSLAQLIAN